MSLVALANHVASKGRGDDKMLVHMTPGEVKGLQALALAHGGSLTINPETGLVEAGWLKSLLPMIAGIALGPAGLGLMSAGMAGLTVGGVTALATGSLKQGIVAGLGAFGGANLGAGLSAAGAQEAILNANPGLAASEIAREMGTPGFVEPTAFSKATSGISALGTEAGRQTFMDAVGGVSGLAKAAAMAGAPAIAAGMQPSPLNAPKMAPGNINRFSFDPFSQTYTRLGSQPAGMNSGGIVALADGGAPNPYAAEIEKGQQAIPYAQGTAATEGEIKNIYQQLLRREADPGGLAFYGASQFSPEQIRQEIMKSEEFKGLPAFKPEPAPVAFQPTAPTMQEVRTGYEQGGGSTTMPSVNVLGGGERPMTQNAVVDQLQAYLSANPNATGDDIRAWGVANGVPAAQLNAAINERRFSMLTGGSKNAYDYLMGRGAYPTIPSTPTGEIMRPYSEAVLGMPVDKTKRKFIFDPATKKYVTNPDYVSPPATGESTTIGSGARTARDPLGNPYTGLAAAYFAANPDVQKAFETDVKGMTPDEYVRFHWNTFGKNEGRKGFLEEATATPAAAATTGIGGIPSSETNSDIVPFNSGGITALAGGGYNLGGYSDGGRLLRGPGDGVSDSIPATIGNKQPARLADGEFVVPARIVSEIGNGSTEAGARKLYAMMDRVQRARSKTVGKGKVAKNTKAEQFLPA